MRDDTPLPVRTNEAGDAPITNQHTITVGDRTLTIEYRPRGRVLDTHTPEKTELADAYLMETPEPPELIVRTLYEDLVETLFPAYNARDQPWDHAPLVLSYDHLYGSTTLGGMGGT